MGLGGFREGPRMRRNDLDVGKAFSARGQWSMGTGGASA